MTRSALQKKLKYHDWAWRYSDDPKAYRQGCATESEFSSILRELECPFELHTLRSWSFNMVLEEFELEEDGYYRVVGGILQKNFAPATRSDLIERFEFDEVQAWFDN